MTTVHTPELEPNSITAANSLAERLRLEIIERGLKENELFMTEDDICVRHSISRSVAREAVSQLRALGILKSRQGKGLLAGKATPVSLFSKTLPFLGSSPAETRQLVEFRSVLELGAVDQAVQRATPEQVQELIDIADRFAEAVEAREAIAEEIRLEMAFHGLLLTMTGNALVAGMHQVIAEYFRVKVENYQQAPLSDIRRSAWEHQAIARAVAQRDAELARSLLRNHLGHARDREG